LAAKEHDMIRTLAIAAALIGMTGAAAATDLASLPLRGALYESSGGSNWSGFYAGALAGYSSADFDMGNGARNAAAQVFRGTTLEADTNASSLAAVANRDARSAMYGGFIGYNWAWDGAVLGFEADYNHSKLKADGSDRIGRSYVDAGHYQYNWQVDARAKSSLSDIGTFRARAGWDFGNFLPYMTFGVAVARGKYDGSTDVTLMGCQQVADINGIYQPCTPTGTTQTIGSPKKNTFTAGMVGGLGLDMLLTDGIFARLEYQHIRLYNSGEARHFINIARAGMGVRF
jgi:opacity protein-like surface antigen